MKQLTVSGCSRLWSLILGYVITSTRIGSLKRTERKHIDRVLRYVEPFIFVQNYNSGKVVDRILDRKITLEQIQSAAQYEKMIKPRLQAIIHLKEALDNEFILYSYMPKMYPFYTSIKADYVISKDKNVVKKRTITYTI